MPDQQMLQKALPNTPKTPLARYLADAHDITPAAFEIQAPEAVTVKTDAAAAGFQLTDELDAWLCASPQAVVDVTIPDGFTSKTPIKILGPKNGGGLLLIHVGEDADVSIQERYESAGQLLGLGLLLDMQAGSTVNWVSYDAFHADTAVIRRKVLMAAHTRFNGTVAGFSQNSGASLFDVALNGLGANATVNVGVLASGRQQIGYTTAITNYARKTVGHINQRGVITGSAHLVYNGIGHIVKGAAGSDAQQENRVLMLNPKARGDANPILLIDENDVTAGHAASLTRVDVNQLYYLMSRGLPKRIAQRLVIRGFLEKGLSEIADKELKKELFATIDETLVKENA